MDVIVALHAATDPPLPAGVTPRIVDESRGRPGAIVGITPTPRRLTGAV
jgi:hypothetical protein